MVIPLGGCGGEGGRERALSEDATPKIDFEDFEGRKVDSRSAIAPRSAMAISSVGTCHVAFYSVCTKKVE